MNYPKNDAYSTSNYKNLQCALAKNCTIGKYRCRHEYCMIDDPCAECQSVFTALIPTACNGQDKIVSFLEVQRFLISIV